MRRFIGCGSLTEMLDLERQLTHKEGCSELEIIEFTELENDDHMVSGNAFEQDAGFVLIWNGFNEKEASNSMLYLRFMVGYAACYMRNKSV